MNLKRVLPMVALVSMTYADGCGEVVEPLPAEVVEPICEPNFYEYHNRISVFGSCHQAYERIKTDALYAGIEVWAVSALSDPHRNYNERLIGEAEFRMGYNYFYNGRDHVTPFLGVGVFKDFRKEKVGFSHHHHKDQKPAIAYGVFGVLYDHEFNSVFNLGLNFKGLVGGPVNKKHVDWGSPVGGIDVSVPITFRFGNKRHWDIRLEPFDIYMHGSRLSRNYVGGRGTVGYRF